MSPDPNPPSSTKSDFVNDRIEREFVLMPLWRRLRERVRRDSGASPLVVEKLPPDTIILYPDRFGNYVSGVEFRPDEAQEAKALEVPPQSPEFERGRAELPLGVANLSYFAQHAAAADAQARADEERSTQTAPQEPEFEVQRTLRPSFAMLVLEMMSSPHWRAAKPALGYGALGFLTCLLMFLVPVERRPASVLLPADEGTSAPVAAAKANPTSATPALQPVHGAGVTIVIPSSGTAAPNSVRSVPAAHKTSPTDVAEDVVIHHYAPTRAEARVQRAKADIKRYSDMP